MPEEKVSQKLARCSLCGAVRAQINREGTKYGACTLIGCKDPLFDYRQEQLTSAADAGPRQYAQGQLDQFLRMKEARPFDPCYWDLHEEKRLRDAVAASPVPQEAAPGIDQAARARLAEHRPSRYDALPATAPDSAMRVAEKLYRDVYQDCDCNHDTSDFDIFKAAALIREAGSEWERVSAPGVSGNVVSVLWPDGTPRELRSSIKQASQLIAMLVSFVNSGESMDDQSNHDIALWRAEASRLLGGN